jgi:hypothetical protein
LIAELGVERIFCTVGIFPSPMMLLSVSAAERDAGNAEKRKKI